MGRGSLFRLGGDLRGGGFAQSLDDGVELMAQFVLQLLLLGQALTFDLRLTRGIGFVGHRFLLALRQCHGIDTGIGMVLLGDDELALKVGYQSSPQGGAGAGGTLGVSYGLRFGR